MSWPYRILLSLGAAVGIGLVVILALVSLGVAFYVKVGPVTVVIGTPERHADGDGPLASSDGHGGSGFTAARVPGVTSWTYGMRLCIATGTESPVLESVGPTLSIGTGYRFLGAGVREFLPKYPGHTPIISVDPYPPPLGKVPDTLHEIHAYAVTTHCTDSPDTPYTELLIGLGVVSDAGGGWQGVDVGYTYGGHHRILAIDIGLLICGTSVPVQCPVIAPR